MERISEASEIFIGIVNVYNQNNSEISFLQPTEQEKILESFTQVFITSQVVTKPKTVEMAGYSSSIFATNTRLPWRFVAK